MRAFILGASFCAVFIFAQSANAQIAEVRVGVTEFDEQILDFGITAHRADENSAAFNAEVIFEEPKFLKWALTPQPYINGTLNVEGNTSFGGAGLMWRQSFGKRFYADFSFGGVIHDGTKTSGLTSEERDAVRGDDREAARAAFAALRDRRASEISFGSRLLFREQLTLGVRVDEEWAAEVFFEHLSNAGLSESSINEGVDSLGIKAARRF